jgi:ABC-2 type transport system ATP-binding protein
VSLRLIPSEPPPLVDVRALSKFHGGAPALHDVSFSIAAGALVAVVGPPGAGKSTLVRTLAGLVTPTGGRIRISGLDPRMSRFEVSALIGLVPQDPPSYGDMRARDVLEFSGRARGLPPGLLARRIDQATAMCRIAALLDTPGSQLDHAGRLRVTLAQALLHDPAIVLLDGWLDQIEQGDVEPAVDVLASLHERKTVVVAGPASILSRVAFDQVLMLDNGRVAFSGAPVFETIHTFP